MEDAGFGMYVNKCDENKYSPKNENSYNNRKLIHSINFFLNYN